MTQFAKVVFRHAANSGHRIAMLPERKLQTGGDAANLLI